MGPKIISRFIDEGFVVDFADIFNLEVAEISPLEGFGERSAQKLTEEMDRHDRAEMESSVSPVFVELSTKAAQDNLRYLIKKSIGVDLLSK